jgi:hypothetical protein
MMKRTILVPAAIFLVFVLIGLARSCHPRYHAKPPVEYAASRDLPAGQHGLILIHADHLSGEQDPQLISVWSMLIDYEEESAGPLVIFKALYPDPFTTQSQEAVASSFALNTQGA